MYNLYLYNPSSLKALSGNILMIVILKQYKNLKLINENNNLTYEGYLQSLNLPHDINLIILDRYNLAKIIYNI